MWRTPTKYSTPPSIFVRFGSGCTLDVRATAGKATCAEHYTKAQDGLSQPWHGTVWMNPPYGDLLRWCAKAYQYAKSGGTVIYVLPAWTNALWFHEYVRYGRITFLRGNRLMLREEAMLHSAA
jgi:site-specific DNA-methyltransferase (adenine-specific)